MCACGLGSGNVIDAVPSGVVPDTTGIRLQTASGTPSFDSEGQVQGRLEVKVGDDWVTLMDGHGESFSGSGDDEAMVACRQLGNELGYTLVSASKVSADDTDDGSGKTYQVICAGEEATINSCTSLDYWSTCCHNRDVGVSCTFVSPGDECEECVAGKFSDNSGVAACTSCAAGSYSTVVGSVSAADCQQVRVEGGAKRVQTKDWLACLRIETNSALCSARLGRGVQQGARRAQHCARPLTRAIPTAPPSRTITSGRPLAPGLRIQLLPRSSTATLGTGKSASPTLILPPI
jgi:hypothetical protein